VSKRHLYMQLTNKCDQQCAHCAFNCGPWNSDFMSEEVVDACMAALRTRYFERVTLGGGEPTLYSHILPLIVRLNQECPDVCVGVVSNGTGDPEVLRMLIHYAEFRGNLSVEISTDKFHRPLDRALVEMIQSVQLHTVQLRTPELYTQPLGRARKFTPRDPDTWYCGCSSVAVSATGNYFPCGCGLEWGHECGKSLKLLDILSDRMGFEAAAQYAPRCLSTVAQYEEWVSTGYYETIEFLREFEVQPT
jgi:hypothetical protein